MLKSQSLVLQNVTTFGDRAFKEVTKVKRSHRWALTQHDQCAFFKRGDQAIGIEQRRCEDPEKTAIYKPRRKALRGTNLADISILYFQHLKLLGNKFLLSESVVLCYGSPSKLVSFSYSVKLPLLLPQESSPKKFQSHP